MTQSSDPQDPQKSKHSTCIYSLSTEKSETSIFLGYIGQAAYPSSRFRERPCLIKLLRRASQEDTNINSLPPHTYIHRHTYLYAQVHTKKRKNLKQTKTKAETNKIETKRIIQRIKETKSWFLKQDQKALVKLSKENRKSELKLLTTKEPSQQIGPESRMLLKNILGIYIPIYWKIWMKWIYFHKYDLPKLSKVNIKCQKICLRVIKIEAVTKQIAGTDTFALNSTRLLKNIDNNAPTTTP